MNRCQSKPFTIKDFMQFLNEAVQFSPKHKMHCKQLQSFVVLDSKFQLKNDNFGKDFAKYADTDYLFIRNKQKRFPALVFQATPTNVTGRLTKKQEHCYDVEIGIIDLHKPDCKNCKTCGNRTIEEIECDTKDLFDTVDAYLQSIKCVAPFKMNDDGTKEYLTDTEIWASCYFMDAMVEKNQIDGYEVNVPISNKLLKYLSSNLKTIRSSAWKAMDTYIGYYEVWKICERHICKTDKYKFNIEKHPMGKTTCC